MTRPAACLLGSAILAGFLACGCSSWKPADGPVPSVLGEKRDRVRLEMRDGAEFVVHRPELRGDTLHGQVKVYAGRDRDRFYTVVERDSAIPIADVRVVEVRKGDALKAVGLGFGVLGIVAIGALIAIAITLGQMAD